MITKITNRNSKFPNPYKCCKCLGISVFLEMYLTAGEMQWRWLVCLYCSLCCDTPELALQSVTPAHSPWNSRCLECAIYSASWAFESYMELPAAVVLLSGLLRFSVGAAVSVQASAM